MSTEIRVHWSGHLLFLGPLLVAEISSAITGGRRKWYYAIPHGGEWSRPYTSEKRVKYACVCALRRELKHVMPYTTSGAIIL